MQTNLNLCNPHLRTKVRDPLRRQRLRARQVPSFLNLRPSEFRLGWPLFFWMQTMQTVVLSADATLFALIFWAGCVQKDKPVDPNGKIAAKFLVFVFLVLNVLALIVG